MPVKQIEINGWFMLRTLIATVVVAFSASFSPFVWSERSFSGPDAVPVFHPLCMQPLKRHQENGGAFDMNACLDDHVQIPVKLTPGGYYAKQPMSKAGEQRGFTVYQPIGVLDDSMELLLVHNKQGDAPLQSEIYVIGRIPDDSTGVRDYLTSITEEGQRCNGGIKTAQLLSETVLLVELNANPETLMRLAGDPSYQQRISDEGETAALNLISPTLDARSTACIGTVVKQYNLIDNQEGVQSIHINRMLTGKTDNTYQACFDHMLEQQFGQQAHLTLAEFQAFSRRFLATCHTQSD